MKAQPTDQDQPPDMPQPVAHRLLALADSGRITRHPHPVHGGWIVVISHRPATDVALLALSVLTTQDLIQWWPCGEGVELALPTPAGTAQLASWDAELFGGGR